jgi:radical SAM protein with 4Fe4S-binding SPASM domain
MEINVESRFAVPPMFHRYERDEWTLLYDPRNHVVVRANQQGLAVVEAFMRHPILRDAIQYIAESYAMGFEQVAKPVIDFSMHLVNAGFLHIGEYKAMEIVQEENDKLDPPESLYIQNTERCNLSCVYCYNLEERAYFVKEHHEMSTEQMKWALDQMVDFGIPQFNFCGGEATLRDDLLEVAAHVRSRGRLICLVTNGQKDTDEFTREAARLFDVIWVSIDSHVKETAEKHRGKGSYDPAMNCVRKLAKVPGRKATLTVSAVASHLNWQELTEFRRVCLEEIGVDRFRATTYCSGCAASAETSWPLQPPPFVKDPSVPFPDQVEFSDLLEFDRILVEYDLTRERLRQPGMRNHCGVGKGEMAMLSNGDIFPCQLLCMPQYLVGNIFEQPIREVFYHSEVLKRLRGLTVDYLPGCATCDVKYVCVGGCRANALETHGSIAAHNTYHCNFYHRLAVDALWRDAMIPVQKITEARAKFQEKVDAALAEKHANTAS